MTHNAARLPVTVAHWDLALASPLPKESRCVSINLRTWEMKMHGGKCRKNPQISHNSFYPDTRCFFRCLRKKKSNVLHNWNRNTFIACKSHDVTWSANERAEFLKKERAVSAIMRGENPALITSHHGLKTHTIHIWVLSEFLKQGYYLAQNCKGNHFLLIVQLSC